MGGWRSEKAMSNDFDEKLAYSKGKNGENDIQTIRTMLGCLDVRQADVSMDKRGVDYIATLRRGAQVFVDSKTREPGCRKYWRSGEEVAVEIWSVMPGGKHETPIHRAKIGWTLDESKITDYILYTWDKTDCEFAYLVAFQVLRVATRRNLKNWIKMFGTKIQNSGSWESQAVFVPIGIVLDAMRDVQKMAA